MTRLGLKCGKVFSFHIGSTRIIVLNDAKVIKEAFQVPELCTSPKASFEDAS